MKKLRIIAKVYDRKTMEYVQRIAEIPVTDEVITGIQAALQSGDSCPIHAFGHGDSQKEKLQFSTPLRDQSRFYIDPQLRLIDIDETTGKEECIGGWQGM